VKAFVFCIMVSVSVCYNNFDLTLCLINFTEFRCILLLEDPQFQVDGPNMLVGKCGFWSFS
jgi:hypothetical protein